MTGPDLSAAPPVLQALAVDLGQAGFRLTGERGRGAVDRLLELTGPGCSVRLSADRGQWWVEVARTPVSDWYDPDVWVACLDDRALPLEPSPLAVQAEVVRRRWREVAAAGPAVTDRLAATRAARARRRLGLPPDHPP